MHPALSELVDLFLWPDKVQVEALDLDHVRATWTRYLREASLNELFFGPFQTYSLSEFFTRRAAWFEAHGRLSLARLITQALLPQLSAAQLSALVQADAMHQQEILFQMEGDDERLLTHPEIEARLPPSTRSFLSRHRHHQLAEWGRQPPMERVLALMRHMYAQHQLDPYYTESASAPTLLRLYRQTPEALALLRSVVAERRLAAAMALHPRLGAEASMRGLDAELMRVILNNMV
jgi:hypothetical protein